MLRLAARYGSRDIKTALVFEMTDIYHHDVLGPPKVIEMVSGA
jgi:hypothetical protein